MAVAGAGDADGVGDIDGLFEGVTDCVGEFDGVLVPLAVAVLVSDVDAPGESVDVDDGVIDGVFVGVGDGRTQAFNTAPPLFPLIPTVAAFKGALAGLLTVTSVGSEYEDPPPPPA